MPTDKHLPYILPRYIATLEFSWSNMLWRVLPASSVSPHMGPQKYPLRLIRPAYLSALEVS